VRWCESACARSRRRRRRQRLRLDRFFAVQGVETPAAEAEQLAALEAYVKEGAKKPPAATAELIKPGEILMTAIGAGGDRAEDITAAVQLSTLAADRKVELISELLAAKDGQTDRSDQRSRRRRSPDPKGAVREEQGG
jgi:3,4-dihydroxy-2-butanone 4-phosphate synthase